MQMRHSSEAASSWRCDLSRKQWQTRKRHIRDKSTLPYETEAFIQWGENPVRDNTTRRAFCRILQLQASATYNSYRSTTYSDDRWRQIQFARLLTLFLYLDVSFYLSVYLSTWKCSEFWVCRPDTTKVLLHRIVSYSTVTNSLSIWQSIQTDRMQCLYAVRATHA